MLLSLSWLREFVPYEGTGAELGDRLTMAGLELDGLSRPHEALRPLRVGFVAECGRHPEADRLSVCRVDVGDEVLDIVCGAPNVARGQKVAVVKAGMTLPGGLAVKKTKLRGAPSRGMICSERELGLSDEHEGILVLDPATPVGASVLDALGLDDEVLDISVTPNRGDCLSVLGLAREVAAITGLPLSLPRFPHSEAGPSAEGEPDIALNVVIERPDLCPLYHGRIIEGVKSAPSPAWLRYRLRAAGVRALSNLVDVTNYVLLELGQPLHAFDLDRVRGGRIIVRAADEGERFTTLDGQERVLTSSDITIRDAGGVIALGGVMGGLDSEITAASSRVFLESAVFDPPSIRRTSRRLGLKSEASFRFERGVDQTGATFALMRAARLMAELSGGRVRPGVSGVEALPWESPAIRLRRERAESLLGLPLAPDFCENTLRSLGCAVERLPLEEPRAHGPRAGAPEGRAAGPGGAAGGTGLQWTVIPPGYRRDLSREADLIEELVRIHGVDRIPPSLPDIARDLGRAGQPESKHSFLNRVRHWGRGTGLHESISYSFVGNQDLDRLGIPASGRIGIMNPLSDDLAVLRPHLAPGLLGALRNNLAQGAASVRLFEIAAAFTADPESETTAHEETRLGILLHGSRHDQAWPRAAADLDYLDLKGILEHLFASLSLPAADFSPAGDESASPWLLPDVAIGLSGSVLGFAGRVKAELAEPYHAKKPVWMAEINLDALLARSRESRLRCAPLPVFPPVRRDITFIAGTGVSAGAILEAVTALTLPLLADVGLVDCFEPQNGQERRLTYRLTFRHAGRTLKDAEADKQRDAVADAVQKVLPVRV